MTVTVYSTNNCPQCQTAKDLLNKKDVQYIEVKVRQDMEIDSFIEKFPDVKSFPFILDYDGSRIGGTRDLQEWLNKQESVLLMEEMEL